MGDASHLEQVSASARRWQLTQGGGLAFAALVGGNVAIAFGPIFVRLADTGPVASGFWRLALAVPIMAMLAWRAGFRCRQISRANWLLLLVAGVAFGADIIAWHIGIFLTKTANATLLANCASLMLAVIAIVQARRLPDRWQGSAVLLAFAGAALLMGQSLELSPANFRGDMLCLFAGLLYTVYLLALLRVRASTESWGALTIASAIAALTMLPVSIAMGERIIPGDWTPLLLLALSSQIVGQGLLTLAMVHFSPLVIGLALLIQPALSAAAGWVYFGEGMTPLDFVGSAMVMAALVLVRLAVRAPTP